MKSGNLVHSLLAIATLITLTTTTARADKYKADNANPLNQAASWTNNAVPDETESAVWDSTVAAENTTTTLGADTVWGGISILNPGGPVVLAAGNTLTLNGVARTGNDPSGASQDLTLDCGVTPALDPTWSIQSGCVLSPVQPTARPLIPFWLH